jgi:hypothetical protein
MSNLIKFACGLLFAAATAAAQVSFTIDATVNAATNGNNNPAGFGYTAGQAVSFTWVLNNFAPTAPTGTVTAGTSASSNFEWADEHVTDTQLWSSFSGTGLSGTWHRAVSDINAPADHLVAFSTNGHLYLIANTDILNDSGLTVNGVGFRYLEIEANFTGLNFGAISGPLPDPTAYFSAFAGTYAASFTASGLMNNSSVFNFTNFTVNTLTITAVPEPSTWLSLTVGGIFLAAAGYRRRRGTQR